MSRWLMKKTMCWMAPEERGIETETYFMDVGPESRGMALWDYTLIILVMAV